MLNLAHALERSAFLHPAKQAIAFADKAFTYAQLNAVANQVANGLVAKGIGPGDKVALSCPNLPYFPMIYYGILKTGAAVVPLNVLFKGAEVAYHLKDSEAKAYFCFEGTAELPMGQAGWAGFNEAPGCEHFFLITADPTQPPGIEGAQTLGMLLKDQPPAFQTAATSAEDTAVILYTSGTTGQPKGAELTHANMAINALASQLLMKGTENDTTLIVLPLFHSFGQTVLMNATVYMAGKMVLIPRFDPKVVFAALQQHAVTVFAGVPTMYIGLLNFPGADEFDLKTIAANLRLGVSGGASLPVEVLTQFQKKFDVTILEGYGLSETSPVATFNYIESERIPGSIGQPLQGVEVRIMDAEGKLLGPDEVGEVVIRGHNVMKGYYRRPEATAEAMRGGWFHSGDIGKQDANGNFYIVDRLKDMILRGGYNVYPREIEEVLMQHESVAMAAVIGIPHPTHGEEIMAIVVPKPGAATDAEALKAWTKERLADYKYPRVIEYREQLPMTATGKILKKELKAELG